jgi:hypothetical protein
MEVSIVKDLLGIKLISHEGQMMMQWNTNVIKNVIVIASIYAYMCHMKIEMIRNLVLNSDTTAVTFRDKQLQEAAVV